MHEKPGPRFLIPIFSLLSLLAMLLSSCTPAGTPPANNNNTDKAVNGGIWVDDFFNEPDSLIPNASNQTFSVMLDQAIYAPLFTGDPSGQIIPGIASVKPTSDNGGISKDLKTWTIHLRPGLKWSDGQPLNADDIDFTWRLWANPKFGAAGTYVVNQIQSAEVSADKLTITFHLKIPYSPFLTAWTDGGSAPLPKHYFENIPPDQIKKSKDNLNPSVVSGPFMMEESKPGDHYTVKRNPNYYRAAEGLPHLDKIVFRAVPNQDTILKDLQSGAIDSAWFLDVTKIQSYKGLANYDLVVKPGASYEHLHLNLNNKALQDVNVRKAMAMAVNRPDLVKIARRGQAEALCTDHSKAYKPGYQADAKCIPFDIDGANKLLDSAGWVAGPDGVRQKNGLRLEFMYSTTAGNLWRADDEAINQANFKKIGIKVTIKNYPASTFFSTFLRGGVPGTYDIAEFASSYSYDPNTTGFTCSQIPPNGSNYAFYCNKQMDDLVQQQLATADPDVRQKIFNQIHDLLLTDLPIITLFNPSDIEAAKKGTHNYNPGPFGASETVNVWDWWCTGGKCPSAG